MATKVKKPISHLPSHAVLQTRSQLNRKAMGPIQVVRSAYAERDIAKTEKMLGDFSGVLKLYIGGMQQCHVHCNDECTRRNEKASDVEAEVSQGEGQVHASLEGMEAI